MDWAARAPWSIAAVVLALVGCGWLGIARAEELAGGDGAMHFRQFVWSVLALAAMLLAVAPRYRMLPRMSYWFLAIALVLLAVVYLFPPVRGTHRWLRIGPIGFQPSEFAKLAFVLALAHWLMYRDNYRRLRGLMAPLLITVAPVLLILREPDLGTSLVFFPVLFAMLFAAGARRRDLAVVACCGLLLLPLLWSQMSREQKSRVTAVFSPAAPGERPDADQYHLHRAKATLAVGGLFGTRWQDGEETSPRKFLVPAAATASVICVLGERYGLVGVMVLLALYVLLVWRCLSVAGTTQEPFGRLVVVGIAALIGTQVLVNVCMLVGLLPITGLSLPLVSYGGSGLVMYSIALGLVINIGGRPGFEVAGEPYRYHQLRRAA